MQHTCAVVGAKGGTTKTSSVAALGHIFALSGFDTVLLDTDPQATLTRRFGAERVADPLSAEPLELPIARRSTSPCAGRLLLLPGGRRLELADELDVGAHILRARGLGAVLLVDTPPTLGPIVRAALRAADLVVVPSTPGRESLDGFSDMLAVAQALDPTRRVRAVLTLANTVSRICRWSRNAFASKYAGSLYDVVLPIEMAAAESGTLVLPVTMSAPRSRTADAYRRLAAAIAQDLALTTATIPAEAGRVA